MQRIFIVFGILAAISIVTFQPSFSAAFQRFLLGAPHAAEDAERMAEELASLKAELAGLREFAESAKILPDEILPARVFSRYPFNFKNELTIAAGREQGVAVGDAVVVPVAV